MFSNQMPAESVLTSSCRDSSICCSRVISSHIGVPYSDTHLRRQEELVRVERRIPVDVDDGRVRLLDRALEQALGELFAAGVGAASIEAVIVDVLFVTLCLKG